MELKYIVTGGRDFAIFTKLSNHSDIAKGMYGKPIGAGFCNIRQEADSDRINVHCYGNSITLDLISRIQDEELINNKINS